jgi:mono/diheme cytochrome c family protein
MKRSQLPVAFLVFLAFASPGSADQGSFAQTERGRYLAAVGDCEGCHTRPGGAPFTGNRPIETPFGTIYSPNITPDAATGIGRWSDDQFYRAVHDGIDPAGHRLYPAFPYPWFTHATRQDVDAIYAYLKTLEPVRNERRPNTFPWPIDNRLAMVGWDKLFFKAGEYQNDPKQSAEWNRGGYLVEGLGHCGACHSPRNVFGAVKDSEGYHGSQLQDWWVPALTSDRHEGIGSWSEDEIVTFLRTGRTDHAAAYGPMAEVVHYSTSRMTDADLHAIAIYLKSLPAASQQSAAVQPSHDAATTGASIYAATCSACHQSDGSGVPQLFPRLKADPITQSSDPTTVVRLILTGGQAVATDSQPTAVSMPAFGWKLSDSEVAAVANYVRTAWGNSAPEVSADTVGTLRKAVQNAPAN